MTAPAHKNIKSLNGKWTIDKKLSDDVDPVLALQGIGWLIRKTVSFATVTQHVHTYVAEDGVPRIDVEQHGTAGLKGTTEKRTLDWTFRGHSDWMFGDLQGRSRYTTLAKVLEENKGKEGGIEEDAKFLCDGWLAESQEGDVVETYVRNEKNGWSAWQVWGFADVEVGGKKERYHVRRVAVRKGEQIVKVRLVLAWVGELDKEEEVDVEY